MAPADTIADSVADTNAVAPGPGPDAPEPCLYVGHVMHRRLRPFVHGFRYRVFALLLDIDRIEESCARLRLLALDRFGLLGFHRRDHGARDGSALRPWVEARLAEQGLARPAQIWLLSFPRILGYVFNPLSVYWCTDAAGRLQAVVYEVKNTFGDQHPYVMAAATGEDGAARHEQDKRFFVSPFLDMGQRYRFTVHLPGRRLSIRIRQGHAGEGPSDDWLIATQHGMRRPLSDAALLRAWAAHPLMTLKVMVAIHWQALRLWLKGARFHPYRGAYPLPGSRSWGAAPAARGAQKGAAVGDLPETAANCPLPQRSTPATVAQPAE
ncbi:MAG: DUF1365 domain-containing protein [Pseudomonadota bacterium]